MSGLADRPRPGALQLTLTGRWIGWAVAIAAVYALRASVLPVVGVAFAAFAIAFLLVPLATFFERFMKRGWAVALTYASVLLALAALALLLVQPFVRQVAQLADRLPELIDRGRRLYESVSEGIADTLGGMVHLPPMDLASATEPVKGVLTGTLRWVGNAVNAISEVVLSIVLSWYFLQDRDRLRLRCEWLLPVRYRATARKMGAAMTRELRFYLRGQVTVMLIVAGMAWIALMVVGVESALVLGVLYGVMNIVPYFGPLIGAIPPVLLAMMNRWEQGLIALGALLLIQQIDNIYLSPKIMSGMTGASPIAVLIALSLGSRIAGILGMLLAMPALLVIRILIRIWAERKINL